MNISVGVEFNGMKLTLHGSDISTLNVVFEPCDLLLKFVKGYELILNDEGDLELLDTKTDGDKLGATPNETWLFDGTDRLLEKLHVSFVIPWFNIKRHDRLHAIASIQRNVKEV